MKIGNLIVFSICAISSLGLFLVNTNPNRPNATPQHNKIPAPVPNQRLQALGNRKSMGLDGLASLFSKVRGKMAPTRLAEQNRPMSSGSNRTQAIINRPSSYNFTNNISNSVHASRFAISTPNSQSTRIAPSNWSHQIQSSPIQQSASFNNYNKPLNQINQNKILNANTRTLKNLQPVVNDKNHNSRVQVDRSSKVLPTEINAGEKTNKTDVNTNKRNLKKKPDETKQKVANDLQSNKMPNKQTNHLIIKDEIEIKKSKKRRLNGSSTKDKDKYRYLKGNNRHDHNLSLYYHQDYAGSDNHSMTLTKALYSPKFGRELLQKPDINQKKDAKSERELFLDFSTEAKDKSTEQNSRFSQIYRETLSRAINKYKFTEHLSHWSLDAVDDIHRLYLSGIKEVTDSQDFLIDKMDNIYNNFITPVRWNT